MKTSNLLQEISHLYATPEAKAQSLLILLEEIQYSAASLSGDKLAYYFIDINHFHNNKQNINPEYAKLFQNLANLVEYYLFKLQDASDPNLFSTVKVEELALYETIYHQFGKAIITSKNPYSKEIASDMDIRIFLVLSGVSRKTVYPARIAEAL